MSKHQNISNPTIITAIRLWWKDFSRSELKLCKKKHEFSDHISCVTSIVAFTMLIFTFIPKAMVEADIIKDNPMVWHMEIPALPPEVDTDFQKSVDIWKNMMVESGSRTFNVNPYIYSPGQAYYGLCQWNTSGHHSGINGGTLEEQLEYLADTIESEMHSSNYQRFLTAETPEQASVIFGQWYERCATPDSRQNEARRAYERFAG